MEPRKELVFLECLCVKKASKTFSSTAALSGKLTCKPAALRAKLVAEATISDNATRVRTAKQVITAEGSLHRKHLSAGYNLPINPVGEGDIYKHGLTANYSDRQQIFAETELKNTNVEKYVGDFGDYNCLQKLFPVSDVATDVKFGKFVGPYKETENLYTLIDEGVFTKDYDEHLGQGLVVADDSDFIQPLTFDTDGDFQYKAKVSNVLIRPDETRFRMRASAPLTNYVSERPPRYTVSNIKLLDPNGKLIVHYEDIVFRGDSDQSKMDSHPGHFSKSRFSKAFSKPRHTDVNLTVFSSAPKKNLVRDLYEWQDGYPSMHQKQDYVITFDVNIEALDEAFTEGFDGGFEDRHLLVNSHASGSDYLALDGTPMSTQDSTLINPANNIRITAIEICNSGLFAFGEGHGPRPENYLRLFTQVPVKGRRLEKKIYPNFMPIATFDTGIWPSVSSIWYPNDLTSTTNQDECGSEHIVKNISDGRKETYATLHTIGPHLDSGKLTLKFTPSNDLLNEVTQGPFHYGFDQSLANSWYSPSGAFKTENKKRVAGKNGYFTVDSVTLKVKAKKENSDVRNFALDVVGYSDDKILNVTKAPSGFLQNPSGVQVNNVIFASEGYHPFSSGFKHHSNDFALGGDSLSEKDEHFRASGNAGGDHYSLATYPIVSTTDFVDYEVPLKIFDDKVKVGLSRRYDISSMFEHLYLDIYPLPSGATIADIHLLVRFAPQDAFMMSIQGGEHIRTVNRERSETKIFPIPRGSSDDAILNAGSGYHPISFISGIPNAYTTPSSIKTNYSRRWRGQVGTVVGPFDVDMFDFGFENRHVPFPFKLGYYDFNDRDASSGPTNFLNRNKGLNLMGSGTHNKSTLELKNGNYQFDIVKNIGWRFSSGTLFEKHLPDYTTSYETIDWTSYATGIYNFQNDDLYGKIADAFDTAVRVSGQAGGKYFDLSSDDSIIDTSGGFSVFLRFSPDQNVSGVNYNLFDSGVLLSKWEVANDLDWALGYKDGYLTAYAKDFEENVIQIQDTLKYHAYQYPLSILLTYNDNNQSGLKLYTDNEANKHTLTEAFSDDFDGEHVYLRAESAKFRKAHVTTSDGSAAPEVTIGWSPGSGVGFNMFVTDFGMSTWESGVDSGAEVIYPYGSGTNIVEANPDRTHKQVTAEEFFNGIRSKFYEPGENYNTDTYELWNYVNEDTTADWSLGDFQYKEFTHSFSSLGSSVGKRKGRDLISFHISHHGSGYIERASYAMPTNVDSGVAYHTQIENDFLRFHLSDTPSNFHSVHRRITKSLPQDYKFTEDALVVDTILEHETDNIISWGKCLPTAKMICDEHRHTYESFYGPKLIVSLYTKRQEPRWSTDEPNWGLINRDIHYIPASSSMIKFSSKFDYDSLTDESEQWALFPNEPRYKDFGERYFSDDVDDMFLQYDIVYPSGPPFKSTVNIHSAHVRMDHANINKQSKFGNLNIFASGGNVLNTHLSVALSGGGIQHFNSGILFASGALSQPDRVMPLNLSGANRIQEQFSLFSESTATADSSWNPKGMFLYTKGEIRNISPDSNQFNLVIPKVIGHENVKVPLYIENGDKTNLPSGGYLDLFVYAAEGNVASGTTGLRAIPFNNFIAGRHSGGIDGSSSGIAPLNILGTSSPINRFPSSSMTLFIDTPNNISVTMPLHILNVKKEASTELASEDGGTITGLNLFTANYGGTGSDYIMWYNNNYGTPISEIDNAYAAVPVGNEIRAVDLFGYGSCTGNSPDKAFEEPIATHDTIWRPKTCEEGGIFRATATYSNENAAGFGDTVGYSGNYYGMRRYTGLTPGSPFQATLNIVTGHTNPIDVPREFEDWEYGHCGPEHFVDAGGNSGCCNDGCDGKSLVYSGVKLIGDYPLVDSTYPIDARDATPVSGRNLGDQYGRAVSVVDDLMAISSPKLQIPFNDYFTGQESQIDDAGAIFLYRRGPDVAGTKADWKMEDKLMLPSGYRKDYVERTVANLITYDQWSISGKKWNIGQEGRQLGYSLDICSSGDREVVVAGAPFAKWTRGFGDITTSGLPVSMVVFTDSFNYNKKKVEKISSRARKWDILYKYFAAPWFAGTDYEFQPELDIKLVVFQLVRTGQDTPPVNHDSDFFRHRYISRMDDKKLTDAEGIQHTYNRISSGVKEEFLSMFPYYKGPHSGIPPIMGIFREKSNSAGLGAFYNKNTNNNIVDDFIDFYNDYAYASGVIDPEISPPHNKESGYFNKILGASEDWAETSIDLLNKTLDSGNLIRQDALRYITSGVGQKWAQEDAYEFQIPPSSGGRVYIFEKESGVFNCIQEIKSYADRSTFDVGDDPIGDDNVFGRGAKYNDRYGHAVSISKNAEIISIGSPYVGQSCEIYERDEKENDRMFKNVLDYLQYLGSGVEKFNMILADSGVDVARRVSYHELNPDQRFEIRTKYQIEVYKPIFNYGQRNVRETGTWTFIPGAFLGSTRLGYSTSTSDDGNTVAFGAPTDSMNLFEDTNVWYKGANTWASYLHAGAVRIFESRKIFPHSGVVEFTRFGNLDRSIHEKEREQGFYDQMGLYFKPSKLPFRRTEFEEIEIPRDVGLAFVITPEVDADSDEQVQNIKDWLALGDRTLVLVGNDPIYEENGLYSESNKIINRLLKKLGCRMRITPAATQYESLPDCVSSEGVFNDRYNVTKAHKPEYGRDTSISRSNMFAKGVGDIRIDLSDIDLEDFIQHSPCDEANSDVCNLPLKHMGDLRAEWQSSCIKTVGDRKVKVPYKSNWPFHFANSGVPARTCDNYPESPKPFINRPNEDIVPLLTAAEFLPDEVIIIPARSGENCEKIPCFKDKITERNVITKKFASLNEDFVFFSAEEDANSELSGKYSSFSLGNFIDPEPKNGRDAFLQGRGELYSGKEVRTRVKLLDDSILALEESFLLYDKDGNFQEDTDSDVVVIASVLGENERSFGITGDEETPSKNDDQNVLFYVNLVKDDCSATGKILQLGGWTKRTSFKDAYSALDEDKLVHALLERFEAYNIEVEENFVETDPTADFPDTDKVTGTEVTTLWIANPLGKPDDLQLNKIRNFLSRGRKKLVITYSALYAPHAQEIAENVDYIMNELKLKSRPLYVPSLGEYFIQQSTFVKNGNEQDYPPSGPEGADEAIQIVNPETIPTTGCRNGYGFYEPHLLEPVDTKVDKVALWPHGYDFFGEEQGGGFEHTDYIPVSGGGDFKRIISYADPIFEERVHVPDFYKIQAQSALVVPTLPGSGYRLFVNWVSETNNDHHPFNCTFDEVSFDPNNPEGAGQEGFFNITKTGKSGAQKIFDFVAKKDFVTIVFDVGHTHLVPEKEIEEGRGLPPLTPRIMSVSGCPLPIITEITTKIEKKKVPCDPPFTIHCEKWFEPEKRRVIPGEFRPIKHPSAPYCNPFAPPCPPPKNQECCPPRDIAEIEDGPVIAAEEFEHFSQGVNGDSRSRIVLITDSTMIQGQCPQYRSDSTGENQDFIRSLYPSSASREGDGGNAGGPVGGGGLGISRDTEGRAFRFVQKLRAPERGSAAKYYAISGIQNTIHPLYQLGGVNNKLYQYYDNEDTYHPANPGFERQADPIFPSEIEQEIKRFGEDVVPEWGIYPRFSGDFLNQGLYEIDGTEKDFLLDADNMGGIPELMKLTGHDYLDFEHYNSGCPGDLFGFSVDITNEKLIVGTPFNAFRAETAASGISGIVQWHEIQNGFGKIANSPHFSGIELCQQGGAGAAFYFERTGSGKDIVSEFLPWQWKQKIKPSSINVGMVEPSISTLSNFGDHNLNATFVSDYGKKPDQFGYSVSVDADMIAVGAPNHDFESLHDHSIYNSGEFIRKEFNGAFVIPHHVVHDLGSSGVRGGKFANASGDMVLNNGAVFTFRNKLTNWGLRTKEWVHAEKLYPQGYKDRTKANKFIAELVSGCENDHFGWSVALHRSKRGDSDYTLVAGAPFHDFATSGDHPQSSNDATPVNGLEAAGASYTFDAMLRRQLPTVPNEGGWIDVTVFGDKGEADLIKTRVYQPTQGEPKQVSVSGLIFANQHGSIYIEVSGHDPSEKGFIAHRPFVESVIATAIDGTGVFNSMNLNIFGKPNSLDNAWPQLINGSGSFEGGYNTPFNEGFLNRQLYNRPSGMSLFIPGPSAVNVYNNGVGYQLLNDFGNITQFNESGGNLVPFNLNIQGVLGLASGEPSGLWLTCFNPSGEPLSSSGFKLNINSGPPKNDLDLNIRGG